MSALKRSAAIECTLRTMATMGPVYFWTLTTPDAVEEPEEFSRRWNNFLTVLRRVYKGTGKLRGMRFFEKHPGGHGIHCHFVVTQFLRVQDVRACAEATGFGRIHVWKDERNDSEAVNRYVQKYLHKARAEEWKGVRLYSCFGLRGVASRQSDIVVTSPFKTLWAGVAACVMGFSSMPWAVKLAAVTAHHHAWVCGAAADPSVYVRDNLVPLSTFQTVRLDAEAALARAEGRAWDWGIKLASMIVESRKTWLADQNKRAESYRARLKEWA